MVSNGMRVPKLCGEGTVRRRASSVVAVVFLGLICTLFVSQEAAADSPVVLFFATSFLPQSVEVDRGGSVVFEARQGVHRVRSGLPGGEKGTPEEPGKFFDVTLDANQTRFEFVLPFGEVDGIPFFDDVVPGQLGFIDVATGEATFRVGIVDNAFLPEAAYIFAGDSIQWEHEVNEGLHTVTSGLSSRPEDSPGLLFDEESSDALPVFVYRFETAGTSPYFCRPHEAMGMTGAVYVQTNFVRGDTSMDSKVDVSDAVGTLNYLFASGLATSHCKDAMDANDDGTVNIADPVFTLGFLFSGGLVIPPPYPLPGADRSEDQLRCGF